MTFNTTNRKLTSSTGYLRDKRDGWVCDHDIYLGNEDDKVNYEEITEDEYNEMRVKILGLPKKKK